MSIPLVQNNEKDSINTSIIAIKRNIERINMLLGLVDNDSPDLSGFATKAELEQAETDLAPVDEVTLDNMQSVTSNAVAKAMYNVETYTVTSGLTLYKIGRIVYGQLYKVLSGSSPISLGVLPAKWRPIENCRVCFMDNATDNPLGQFIVYNIDGAIRAYKGNGGSFNHTVVVSFSYFTET